MHDSQIRNKHLKRNLFHARELHNTEVILGTSKPQNLSVTIPSRNSRNSQYLSEIKANRRLAGSLRAAAISKRSASIIVASPHTTCEPQTSSPLHQNSTRSTKKRNKNTKGTARPLCYSEADARKRTAISSSSYRIPSPAPSGCISSIYPLQHSTQHIKSKI